MTYTIFKIKQNIVNKINSAYDQKIAGVADLTLPPNPEMGDFSFACFNLSKETKKNPAQIAQELAAKIKPCQTVKEIKATGPYLNFIIQPKKLAEVLGEINGQYGSLKLRRGKLMVEYGTPNTHKAFHIGHLRNIITGEAIVRILENAGYKVIRANYQGDIGLHIAKSLWGIIKLRTEFEKIVGSKDIDKKIAFLGKAYAFGSKNYEENEKAKAEIVELNKKIYLSAFTKATADKSDKSIKKLYQTTRKWSLDYFAKIYKRVNTKFDRLYFESETFAPGKKIVTDGMKKGIFKLSDGAVIFEGGKHGLHDRVFINSEGNPTYEAKDMALAQLQFSEFNPEKILHVVSKEQTEYFKVIFKALEQVLPKSKNREAHLPYGWVSLKGGKMSSRLGNVVLGESLIEEIKKEILKIVSKSGEIKKTEREKTSEKINVAAVKYAFLKNGIDKDIAFDINESVSIAGNSGPYLLYTYARIQSIIRKSKVKSQKSKIKNPTSLNKDEHQLLFKISLFPEVTQAAAEKLDPSIIAKYLFELAQSFNDYYHRVPVLKAEAAERQFRLKLISAVALVLKKGVELLGFETVERM